MRHTPLCPGGRFRPVSGAWSGSWPSCAPTSDLPVTALTATANRTVRAGLREGVFGLLSAGAVRRGGRGRVTLLLLRTRSARSWRSSGGRPGGLAHSTIARLGRGDPRRVQDHAIFYCLTVKESWRCMHICVNISGRRGAGPPVPRAID